MRRRYEEILADGFEGGVLRSPEGPYKGGRVTEASQIAIKIKPDRTNVQRLRGRPRPAAARRACPLA
jgi:hypothetical protein